MNYTLLSNFPEHLSLSYDSFQFLVGSVLAITSIIRWYHSGLRSPHSIGYFVLGVVIAWEAPKTGALLSSDMLIAFGGIIGYQGYMIMRRLVRDLFRRFGKELVKPSWLSPCFITAQPYIALFAGMAVFVLIHDTLF